MKGGDEEAHCVPFSSHDRVFGHAPTRERGKRIYLCCAVRAVPLCPRLPLQLCALHPFPAHFRILWRSAHSHYFDCFLQNFRTMG